MTHTKVPAQTLQRSIELTGVGLHTGAQATLRFEPAAAGTGIVFERVDLSGTPRVAAGDVDTNAPPFRTAIRRGDTSVHTIEHVLSALAALGITDCVIQVNQVEVPGMDGSARDFVNAIQQAGVAQLAVDVAPLIVTQTLSIEEGAGKITANPNPGGGLKITYTLHYSGHPLAQGTFEFNLSAQSYLQEIANARTFAVRPEAEAMRAAGLGKGATLQNTCIVDGDKVLETTLRFPNEPVRHKILDLIGDLYVLGRPIEAHLVAHCSGHRLNGVLAQRLKQEFK